MARERVTIRKRGLTWQVRYQGKTVLECASQQEAMDYVAAQLKTRAAAKALVSRLVSSYMKGKQQ